MEIEQDPEPFSSYTEDEGMEEQEEDEGMEETEDGAHLTVSQILDGGLGEVEDFEKFTVEGQVLYMVEALVHPVSKSNSDTTGVLMCPDTKTVLYAQKKQKVVEAKKAKKKNENEDADADEVEQAEEASEEVEEESDEEVKKKEKEKKNAASMPAKKVTIYNQFTEFSVPKLEYKHIWKLAEKESLRGGARFLGVTEFYAAGFVDPFITFMFEKLGQNEKGEIIGYVDVKKLHEKRKPGVALPTSKAGVDSAEKIAKYRQSLRQKIARITRDLFLEFTPPTIIRQYNKSDGLKAIEAGHRRPMDVFGITDKFLKKGYIVEPKGTVISRAEGLIRTIQRLLRLYTDGRFSLLPSIMFGDSDSAKSLPEAKSVEPSVNAPIQDIGRGISRSSGKSRESATKTQVTLTRLKPQTVVSRGVMGTTHLVLNSRNLAVNSQNTVDKSPFSSNLRVGEDMDEGSDSDSDTDSELNADDEVELVKELDDLIDFEEGKLEELGIVDDVAKPQELDEDEDEEDEYDELDPFLSDSEELVDDEEEAEADQAVLESLQQQETASRLGIKLRKIENLSNASLYLDWRDPNETHNVEFETALKTAFVSRYGLYSGTVGISWQAVDTQTGKMYDLSTHSIPILDSLMPQPREVQELLDQENDHLEEASGSTERVGTIWSACIIGMSSIAQSLFQQIPDKNFNKHRITLGKPFTLQSKYYNGRVLKAQALVKTKYYNILGCSVSRLYVKLFYADDEKPKPLVLRILEYNPKTQKFAFTLPNIVKEEAFRRTLFLIVERLGHFIHRDYVLVDDFEYSAAERKAGVLDWHIRYLSTLDDKETKKVANELSKVTNQVNQAIEAEKMLAKAQQKLLTTVGKPAQILQTEIIEFRKIINRRPAAEKRKEVLEALLGNLTGDITIDLNTVLLNDSGVITNHEFTYRDEGFVFAESMDQLIDLFVPKKGVKKSTLDQPDLNQDFLLYKDYKEKFSVSLSLKKVDERTKVKSKPKKKTENKSKSLAVEIMSDDEDQNSDSNNSAKMSVVPSSPDMDSDQKVEETADDNKKTVTIKTYQLSLVYEQTAQGSEGAVSELPSEKVIATLVDNGTISIVPTWKLNRTKRTDLILVDAIDLLLESLDEQRDVFEKGFQTSSELFVITDQITNELDVLVTVIDKEQDKKVSTEGRTFRISSFPYQIGKTKKNEPKPPKEPKEPKEPKKPKKTKEPNVAPVVMTPQQVINKSKKEIAFESLKEFFKSNAMVPPLDKPKSKRKPKQTDGESDSALTTEKAVLSSENPSDLVSDETEMENTPKPKSRKKRKLEDVTHSDEGPETSQPKKARIEETEVIIALPGEHVVPETMRVNYTPNSPDLAEEEIDTFEANAGFVPFRSVFKRDAERDFALSRKPGDLASEPEFVKLNRQKKAKLEKNYAKRKSVIDRLDEQVLPDDLRYVYDSDGREIIYIDKAIGKSMQKLQISSNESKFADTVPAYDYRHDHRMFKVFERKVRQRILEHNSHIGDEKSSFIMQNMSCDVCKKKNAKIYSMVNYKPRKYCTAACAKQEIKP